MISIPMKERKPMSSDKAVSPSDKENSKLKYIAIQHKINFNLHVQVFPSLYFRVKTDQQLYSTRNDVQVFLEY